MHGVRNIKHLMGLKGTAEYRHIKSIYRAQISQKCSKLTMKFLAPTIQSFISTKFLLIHLWNVAPALISLKGILWYANVPQGVVKAVLC